MKRALLLLLLAACGSKAARSLVLVEVNTAGVMVDAVKVEVTPASGAMLSQTFGASGGLVRAGIYLPAGVSGTVQVRAVGLIGDQAVATSSSLGVAVVVAGTAGPVMLSLGGMAAVDGGLPVDGAVDGGAVDGGVVAGSVDAAPLPDGGADGVAPVEGPSWHAPTAVKDDPTTSSVNPALATDSRTGNVLVAWAEDNALRVRRYDVQKNAWDEVKTLETRGTPKRPKVGIDGQGHALAVWYQVRDDATLTGLWVSQSTDQVAWSPPVRIAAVLVDGVTLGVSQNGAARVAYEVEPVGLPLQLWSAYYDGQSWSAPAAPVQAGPAIEADTERLVMDSAGHGVLAWSQDSVSVYTAAWATTFDGATVAAPTPLGDATNSGLFVKDAVMNGDGSGMVVWVNRVDGTLWYRTVTAGTGLGPTTRLGAAPSAQEASLAIDHTGTIIVCWSQVGAGLHPHVWSSRLPPGGAWTSAVALETTNTSDDGVNPDCHLVVDGRNDVQAVFTQLVVWPSGKATQGLFASRYDVLMGKWSPLTKLVASEILNVFELEVAGADVVVAAWDYGDPYQTHDPQAHNSFTSIFR